ncbi:MAG: hypothetical protein WDO56_24780 [Gammaproteobacteria bacterium]
MSSVLLRVSALKSLTAISISGADARTFLQGQLSNDLRRLTPQRALLACGNSAQGRVQAVVTLLDRGDAVVALVATSMAGNVLSRLRNYVLRSKVAFVEDPGYAVAPITAADAADLVDGAPRAPGDSESRGSLSVLRWWGADDRYLLVAPRAAVQETPDASADLRWQRADIAAGVPQVYPQTHELFVAQMLNLDLLGGISFDKGCYTGQEIIARTHYRGTIKRRMMRFSANCAVPAPGTRVLHGGAHAGEVADACIAAPESGKSCELLAVISVDRAGDALDLDGIENSSLSRLGLPYVIPQAAAA